MRSVLKMLTINLGTHASQMTKLRVLTETIKTTRNFWEVYILKLLQRKRRIVFRNGTAVELHLDEYLLLSHAFAKGYSIEQKKNGLFSMGNEKSKIIGSLQAIEIYARECIGEMIKCDYKNKVVLDIGGFYGETAVFFSSQGAKKVIIYEPVVANHNFIKKNILLNGVNAELHEEGISEEDGYQEIQYDAIDNCFGVLGKGKHTMKILNKNLGKVITESDANIAKFDCEGAEENLVRVLNETLRKIDFYIIECHTPKITKAILSKFSGAGFKLVKKIEYIAGTEYILHFQKI